MIFRLNYRIQRLIKTDDSLIPLILRVFLGIIVFSQSTIRLSGLSVSYAFSKTMDSLVNTTGLPWLVSFLLIVMEPIGAIAVILGAATRLVAFGYVFIVLSLIISSNKPDGIFKVWLGNDTAQAFSFCFLWLAISIVLILTGGGGYSLDKELLMEKSGSSKNYLS